MWDVPRGHALGQKGTRLPRLGGGRACEGDTKGGEPKCHPLPPFVSHKLRERRQPRASSRRLSSAPSPQPGLVLGQPVRPGLSPRWRKRAPAMEKTSQAVLTPAPPPPHRSSTLLGTAALPTASALQQRPAPGSASPQDTKAAHSIATVPSGNFILCCVFFFFFLCLKRLRRRL